MTDLSLGEQLDGLDDADLLKTITAALAKRQTPPTPEEQRAADDDRTYNQYFPERR